MHLLRVQPCLLYTSVTHVPGLICYLSIRFVQSLGVNTTYQDDRAKVAAFARDQGISYPVLLDTEGSVSQTYASRLMPSSFLIDQDGKIVSVRVGEVDEAQLEEQVAALLRGAHTAP